MESKNESEKEVESKNESEKKEVEYVFKNVHRQFTQEDIDYISDVCNGIADIIIKELHDTVTDFFQNKNKIHEGYLFLSEFKEILENELQISVEGTEQDKEDFQKFFDFITSNKIVEGKYIIEIKKLIYIINFYREK